MQEYLGLITRLANRVLLEHDYSKLPEGLIPVIGQIHIRDLESKAEDMVAFRLINGLGHVFGNDLRDSKKPVTIEAVADILQVDQTHLSQIGPGGSQRSKHNITMDVICLKETEEEAFTGGRAWLLLDRVATDWKGELERSERIIAPTRIQRLAVDFPYSPTDESLEVVGITASSGIEYLSQPSGVRVIDFREDWHVILGDLVYGLRQANSGINPAVDFAMDVFVENLALCLDNKKFDRKLMAQALKALIGTTGLPAEPIFKDTVPVKRLTVKSYKIDDTEFFGCAASLQRYKTGQPGLQHILLKDNETETEEQ